MILQFLQSQTLIFKLAALCFSLQSTNAISPPLIVVIFTIWFCAMNLFLRTTMVGGTEM